MNRYQAINHSKAYTASLEKHVNEKQTDSTIALEIYNFLNCNGMLPKLNGLYNLISFSNLGDKISEGYGVVVDLKANEENDSYNIIIIVDTIIDSRRSRTDYITSEKHKIMYTNGKRFNTVTDCSQIKNFPEIDEVKIKYLQLRLKEFNNIDYNEKQKIK